MKIILEEQHIITTYRELELDYEAFFNTNLDQIIEMLDSQPKKQVRFDDKDNDYWRLFDETDLRHCKYHTIEKPLAIHLNNITLPQQFAEDADFTLNVRHEPNPKKFLEPRKLNEVGLTQIKREIKLNMINED